MKRTVLVLFVFTLLILGALPVNGAQIEMPEQYDELIGTLDDSVTEHLPDGIFSGDTDSVGHATLEMTKAEYWVETVKQIIGAEWRGAVILFLELCGLIIVSAVFGALGRSLSSDAMSGAVRFCTTTAIFAAVIRLLGSHFEAVELFFARLGALMGAMIPVTGVIWAMGGNVSTASSGTASMYVFLNVCEGIFGRIVIPVACTFTVFALCTALCPEMGLSGLSGVFKKTYSFLMIFIMTILISALASQTTLTCAADSLSARAGKLISANVIPVVGASIGDALRTVATSVQYLKGIVGIGGIVFVALLLLPTLFSLLLARLAILLASGIANMLGCETEGRFLSELGGVYGILIATVSICSVSFMFALTIFTKTAVALL